MTNPQNHDLSALEFTRGDRARKALQFAGIGVSEMADYLGVTRETAGRYINDKAVMPLQTRRLWSLRTGVPFEWLETGDMCAIRDLNPEPADLSHVQVTGTSCEVIELDIWRVQRVSSNPNRFYARLFRPFARKLTSG